jgi:hypothetical protein
LWGGKFEVNRVMARGDEEKKKKKIGNLPHAVAREQ